MNLRISTKAFMIVMLIVMAVSLCKTEDNIAILCSLNAYGRLLLPPWLFTTGGDTSCMVKLGMPDWHIKFIYSSFVS